MATLRNRVLANLRSPEEANSRAVTCRELEDFLKESHQSVSACLSSLRREGLAYSVGKRSDHISPRPVNAYRLVVDLRAAQAIDSQCGPKDAGDATRDAVVAYLASVTDAEWDSILQEAAELTPQK